MINISDWMDGFLKVLNNTFGERIQFIGLQGSYARNEATESSDIDVVVIFDEFKVADIEKYNRMLDTLPNRELICGFVSGKKELLSWEPSDLFQFYFDTLPIKGTLDELLTVIDDSAVERAIKIGACNIYHSCVHNMFHEKSEDVLKSLYKSAVFVVQAICYKQTEKYFRNKNDLLNAISDDEKKIIDTSIYLKRGGEVDFAKMSETLFEWAQKSI